ncbi:MAG TPA: hypothetical protein VJ872_11730 [Nocardioides sp.]|nr:hypothetical protein [Nocardioides sp.]
MNTIHELRGTLAEHAEIHDVEIGARASAVAHRVRVVRRRRATGIAAAAAAAVVAASVGLSSLGGGRLEAPVATLLGMEVPATQTSTGYTFDYARGATAPAGGHVASVTVDPTDGPVLVSWATEGSDQRVHVTTPTADFHSSHPDFSDFVRVDPGAGPSKVEVSGSSRTALAVYDLGAPPTDGVTTDGITYRRDVAGRHLIAAKIAPEGANRVSLSLTMPTFADHLTISSLCSAAKGWVEGTVDGRSSFGGGCGPSGTFDPAGAGWMGLGQAFVHGQRVTITLQLLDHEGGEPLVDPHARLGVGAYDVAQSLREPHGLGLPRTIESGGHTWRLMSWFPETVRQGRSLRLPLPGSSERFMMVLAANGGAHRTTIIPQVDGHDSDAWLSLAAGTSPASEQVGPIDGNIRTIGARVRGTAAYAAFGIYGLSD